MESAMGGLRQRKKIPYNPQQVENLEVPERRVLRILSRLKQQNYGEGCCVGWAGAWAGLASRALCGQVPLGRGHGLVVWELLTNSGPYHATLSSMLWTLPSCLSPVPRLSLRAHQSVPLEGPLWMCALQSSHLQKWEP